jgi:hypothetical protein
MQGQASPPYQGYQNPAAPPYPYPPAPSPQMPYPSYPYTQAPVPYPIRPASAKPRAISYPLIALGGAVALAIYALDIVLWAGPVGTSNLTLNILPTIAFVISVIPGLFALIYAARLQKWGWLIGTLVASLIPGLGVTLFGVFGPYQS